MPELLYLKHFLIYHLVDRDRDERGESGSVPPIIWIAIGATIALTAGGIIMAKVVGKAEGISLD